MPLRSIIDFFSQRKPLPLYRAYRQTVPLRRLTALLLAIFFMFGMVGCFVDLLDLGQKPFIPVIVWSLFSGFIAVVWVLAFFRNTWWLIGAVALWLLGSRAISIALMHFGPYDRPTSEYGTRVATIACIVLSILAYACFMNFIQRLGSQAVRMQTELAIAQGIQKTLVPPIEFRSDHLEIYGISIPSAEVGGDLVDAVPLPNGSIFAYVADVSGHGLPAGILMGMIKTAVRTQLIDAPSPTALLERLNQVLPEVKESHMYATCTALRIHPAISNACRVDFAIAGQPAMLHKSDMEVRQLSQQQLPVGLLEGARYEDNYVELRPGDTLLVATDGVLEAVDRSGAEFGLDRLEAVLRDNASQPLPAIASKIRSTLAAYRQDDDQSMLLIRFVETNG
jgi:serine phosphatase RsbU (regulator of sigma subunit)